MKIKKNKRKKITRKSRRQVILRSLLAGLAVSAVVCTCGLECVKMYIQKDMDSYAHEFFGSSRERIADIEKRYENNQKEYNEYEWVDRSRYGEQIMIASVFGYNESERYYDEESTAVLYNEDTREIVADSFDHNYIIWRKKGDEESPPAFYSCNYAQPQMAKVLEQADKAMDTLSDYYRLQWKSEVEVDFTKVYVNKSDFTFIPVKGKITAMNYSGRGDQTRYRSSFSFEDDPEFASGAPDGYILEEGEGGWCGNKLINTNEELHQKTLEGYWDYHDSFNLLYCWDNTGFLKSDYCQYGNFSVNGNNYIVVWGLSLDGWSAVYSRWFYISCGIFTFVTLAVSLVSALIRYTKMKAAWDIEDYRINTSNALAHDLKTPLTAMIGYAQNLKDCTSEQDRERYTDSIIENAVYTNELINSYFELSRAEQLIPKTRRSCELVAVAKGLFTKYSAAADDLNKTVTFEGECTAQCDPDSISRAVENLLSNAVKYTPPQGSITVTGDKKSLTVSNTVYEQIPDISRLTEPFYKPDSARGGRSGSGLGLAIVKQITDAHGFTLKLDCTEDRFTAVISF